MIIKFDNFWFNLIYIEIKKNYFKSILKYISKKKKYTCIYPKNHEILKVLKLTKIKNIKVIIIGQDPYCQENQAHGLAFSVKKETKIPPSLKNIFLELKDDIKIEKNINHGCLENWSKQGVFLINSILTVEKNKPLSHEGIGWEILTNKIIKSVSERRKKIFVLLGLKAIKKIKIININKHTIITAPHPSPKSANNNFLGSKIFSKINLNLKINGMSTIKWDNL